MWLELPTAWISDVKIETSTQGALKGHMFSEMAGKEEVPEATTGSVYDQNWTYAAMVERRL